MAKGSGFFEELKRRHVWRVAVAYAVAGWLIVQIATQVFPFFKVPDGAVRLVVILIVIGFPIAVICAWVFEITPEGIRVTEPADSVGARASQAHRSVGQKLNAIITATLVLAVALMGWRLYADHHPATAQVASAAHATAPPTGSTTPVPQTSAQIPLPVSAASVPEKSVAVLPFNNDSGQKDQQFFSDGLSEDLITALSQFDGLKVISRNSAFQFRDSRDTSAQIGKLLGVAHLLEGSVQRAGGEVRITATLVNASDGAVLWTQRYDKPYKDLFALQDDITHAVADALKARLLAAPGTATQSDRPPSGNLAAWTAFQRGRAYAAVGTQTSLRQAIAAYEGAIRLDPRYVAAYAQLSGAWIDLWAAGATATGMTFAEVHANAAAAADAALRLDPDSSRAHLARAYLLLSGMDWYGAEADARRALQLAPNDPDAQFWMAATLATLGQSRPASGLIRRALAADPRHASWYKWLAVCLAGLGQLEQAHAAANQSVALQPDAAGFHEQLAIIEILRGDAKAALAATQHEAPGVWREIALALTLQIDSNRPAANTALERLVADYAHDAPYQIAEVYALRGDANDTFKWLDRAWADRDGGIGNLLYDPFILRFRNDPRFAAFCKKVGLPTTTDAVAMKL